MQRTSRTITTAYIVAVVWLAVMIGVALGVTTSLGSVYDAIGLEAIGRTTATMSLAIAAASLTAAVLVRRLRGRNAPLTPMADRTDAAPEGALVGTR